MDQWIERFRNAKVVEGQEKVLIPGDPEREMESIRRKEGMQLNENVVKDLKEVANKFQLEL
jgi:LDH2 family malate/lactate/ureidoglycolate dehydrogenase